MPIEATPLTDDTDLFTVPEIRRFLRDYDSKNILLDDVEFSDDDIEAAKRWTLLDLNSLSPPVTWASIEAVPEEATIILLWGVCKHLMASEANRQQRNQLTAQDGDVAPIGLDDKAPMYRAAAQYYATLFEDRAKQFKISYNLNSAYGDLSSGYVNVSRLRQGG